MCASIWSQRLSDSSDLAALRPSSDCLDTLDGRIYTVLPLLFRRRTYRRVSRRVDFGRRGTHIETDLTCLNSFERLDSRRINRVRLSRHLYAVTT